MFSFGGSWQTWGKYIEMYLNTNTLEGFKHKWKYFEMQKYLNTDSLESILDLFQILFIFRIYKIISKRKANHTP